MEDQSNAVIGEMIQAVGEEMQFYRELKKRRYMMSVWKPAEVGMNPQQIQAYEQSACDPVLKEVAKNILEEIEYNKNVRRLSWRIAYIVLIVTVVILIGGAGLIIWLTSSTSKYKVKKSWET